MPYLHACAPDEGTVPGLQVSDLAHADVRVWVDDKRQYTARIVVAAIPHR